jgi:hypothetical protein
MTGRRKTRLIVTIVGLLLLAAAAVALVLGLRTPTRDLVKLELRAKPVASIRFKGRNLGNTPLVIQVPRSKQPLPIEATFTEHKLNAMTGQKKVETFKQTLTVTPDDHQSVDFDIKAATKQPDPGR